ncbi:hypothetical protein D3C76_1792010 [compost metagenome]
MCRTIDENGWNIKACNQVAVFQIEKLNTDDSVHVGDIEVVGKGQGLLIDVPDDVNG